MIHTRSSMPSVMSRAARRLTVAVSAAAIGAVAFSGVASAGPGDATAPLNINKSNSFTGLRGNLNNTVRVVRVNVPNANNKDPEFSVGVGRNNTTAGGTVRTGAAAISIVVNQAKPRQSTVAVAFQGTKVNGADKQGGIVTIGVVNGKIAPFFTAP